MGLSSGRYARSRSNCSCLTPLLIYSMSHDDTPKGLSGDAATWQATATPPHTGSTLTHAMLGAVDISMPLQAAPSGLGFESDDELVNVSEVLGLLDGSYCTPLTGLGYTTDTPEEDYFADFFWQSSPLAIEEADDDLLALAACDMAGGVQELGGTEEEPPVKKARVEPVKAEASIGHAWSDGEVAAAPAKEEEGSNASREDTTSCRLGLVSHAYEPAPFPDGWVNIEHASGATVYFHKPTRVCTLARPYHLSPSYTVKKHRVPVQAVPCLEQWLFGGGRSAEAEKWHSEGRVGSLLKLEPHRLRKYLSLRWNMEGRVEGPPLASKPTKPSSSFKRKQSRKKQSSVLPVSMNKQVDLRIPIEYRQHSQGKILPAVWSVNIATMTPVALLFEFCSLYLRTTPEILTEEIVQKNTPYMCTVVLKGVKYGQGKAATKKLAKHVAAQETMELLLPGQLRRREDASLSQPELEKYFSTVSVDDPQAADMLQRAGLPTPWEIFNECHRRNIGTLPLLGEIQFSLTPLPSVDKQLSLFECALSCGEAYSVSVQCHSRKEGQHQGAQAMLKKLHPYIRDWGGLLKIYSGKSFHKTKVVCPVPESNPPEKGVVDHDTKLLETLKQEMRKLAKESAVGGCVDVPRSDLPHQPKLLHL